MMLRMAPLLLALTISQAKVSPAAAFSSLSNSLHPPKLSIKSIGRSTNAPHYNRQRIGVLVRLRGGAIGLPTASAVSSAQNVLTHTLRENPSFLFNSLMIALVSISLAWKGFVSQRGAAQTAEEKPQAVKSLQLRFLMVFWLLRMADWLQGPYFYEVYSSKILNGSPVSLQFVSRLFLVGFGATGAFGPLMGRFVDNVGRRAGTLLYTLLYALGAMSTRSDSLVGLLLGRLAGGLGTSLLFSAPEAWLVGEHQRIQADDRWLGQTFGWAYGGDSLVAITAGQLASWATTHVGCGGPTAPFTLSVAVLAAAAALILPLWKENTAQKPSDATSNAPLSSKPQVRISDAVRCLREDRRIWLLGAVQALFEGAMYIFVLQWPPAMKAAFQRASATAGVPYGNIFSSFMAACFLGSTVFGVLQSATTPTTKRHRRTERHTTWMLAAATAAMTIAATLGQQSIAWLIPALLAFEVCVGMYFPSIGTLRSTYLPEQYRSVIMNLFGLPLNLIVVSVFLSIQRLGIQGALSIASGALCVATVCMAALAQAAETAPRPTSDVV